MKKFIYTVALNEYEDTEPFGEGWKQAKATAEYYHCPIYRTVIEEREEVYMKGGYFCSCEIAKPEGMKIF